MVSVTPAKGMLVGGVDSSLEDDMAKALLASAPKAKCYVDNAESYSTNEVTIYWNSPLVYLLTLSMTDLTPSVPLVGDVNSDGVVDYIDVKLLKDYLLCRGTLTAEQAVKADLKGDSSLNSIDLALLKQKVLQK
jgi:endoglucanase